ncbi:MAG: hypothetical protein EHM61_13165 [Acidobacteria bacterium]|nr:MAG: hypothetical protein EHM61_13165 [Acidobacteriota bacterium]
MVQGLVLLVALAAAGDPDVSARVQKALRTQAETLTHFSVEVENRFGMEGRTPGRRQPAKETHYFGEAGQFKRDASTAAAQAGQAPPGFRRGPGFGPGGNPIPQLLFRADLPARIQTLGEVKVVGTSTINGVEAVELRCRPKIVDLKVGEARLWVTRDSGMPLRLRLRFAFGPLGAEATLTRELVWDAQQKITLSQSQKIEASFGGFGGGGRDFGPPMDGGGPPVEPGGPGGFGGGGLEIVTTWRNYQWGRTFAGNFFNVAAEQPAAAPRRAATTGGQAFDDDPFQEIRLPSGGAVPSTGNTGDANRAAYPDEVLIQGSSVATASETGPGERALMARIIGGFGGEGGGPPGEGGPGGGGPGGGGFRGMMIGGSRANRIQGSATAGLSSSALDAKPYSLDGRETSDPDYLSWRAGVSVGGPLGARTTSSRNRRSSGPGMSGGPGGSSFFVDFSARRGETIESQYGSVPTLLERQGDFSKTVYRSGPLAGKPLTLYDPATGLALPGAVLPSLDPTAAAILSFIPLPNRDDPVLNFLNQQTLGSAENRLNSRLTFALSQSQRLALSYSLSSGNSDRFNIFPDLNGESTRRGQNLSVSWNSPLRPGLVNSLRVEWNRNRSQQVNAFGLKKDIAASLGIQNTSRAPIDYGLPAIQLTNFTSLDDGSSSKTIREKNGFSESLMLVKGKHFFRLGGDVAWNRWNRLGSPAGGGALTFAGVATSQYAAGRPVPGTGYDFADFLLGLAESSRIQYGNSDHYLRRPEFSLFCNDNWRLASRLTLQLGLRYQFVAPWLERYDRLANLDLAAGFSAAQTVVPGGVGSYYGNFPRGLVESDWSNLAPRAALALRLNSGKWASVLRTSYGVFYPSESYEYFVNELMAQPPFGFTVQKTTEGTEYLDIQTAFSEDYADDVANTFAVDPRFRLSTVQNWDLSIQQALPLHLFMSVGYAGSRGTGLELLRAPNRTINGDKLIENAAQFLYLTPGGSSAYHGLQLMVTRRVRSSFTLGGRYEFGKSLDDASSLSGGQRIVAQNDADLDAEWGRSSLDETHRLRLNWFSELPFGERNRWLREKGLLSSILSHWYLTGDLTAGSGRPISARVLGNQINNSGTGSQASERASVTGEPIALAASARTTGEWFNTGAFRLPDPGVFGNAGRNTINGPGSWTVNMNLSRSIPLKQENRRLLVTVQGTNLLNHANYAGINTVVNSTAFGRVTSVGQMRRVQLSFRLMF